MSPFSIRALFAFVLLSLSAQVLAGKLSADQAQKFIHVSGLGATIDSMPEMMQQQFNLQALIETDSASVEAVGSAISHSLSTVNGRQIAEEYLYSRADSASLENTIAWLDTPFGQKIVQAENRANDPAFQGEMQSYMVSLSQNMPAQSRRDLIARLADSTKALDAVMRLTKSMMIGVTDVFDEVRPEFATEFRNAMEQEWENMEPMLREQMRTYIVYSAYYTYQDLSDAELLTYIDFLESKDGQVYWQSSIDIFELYFKEVVQTMTKEIVGTKSAS